MSSFFTFSVMVDGKYTIQQTEDGRLKALHYGNEWRDVTGDNLILTLAHTVAELREVLNEVSARLGCGCGLSGLCQQCVKVNNKAENLLK